MIDYLATILIFFLYNVLVGISANLTIGYFGLFNLGLIAFVGIGAYTYALLTNIGINIYLSILLAMLIPAFFAVILQYLTRKLKGDYFGIATLGFSYVIYAILLNSDFTQGAYGISNIAKPIVFGLSLESPVSFLIFAFISVIIWIIIVWFLLHSRFSRVMEAIRDDEISIKVLGKNTTAIKYKILFFSAMICGYSGFLYASFITYIDPSSFLLTPLITILTIAIIGGLASFWGPIIGAAIVVSLPEILRFIGMPSIILGPLRVIIFSLILIIVLIFWPKGVVGRIKYD